MEEKSWALPAQLPHRGLGVKLNEGETMRKNVRMEVMMGEDIVVDVVVGVGGCGGSGGGISETSCSVCSSEEVM